MSHKIVWLALGTLAIASCTAILGGVPTSGGTGGGAGVASATGPGSGGNGGTPSANGGSGGVGGIGGAGGGSVCAGKGGACGPNTKCCNALSCNKGTCVDSTASNSSSSGTGGGGTNCIGCRQFVMGQQGQLCDESNAKLNTLIACACTATTCEQTCGAACHGGVPDVNCEDCAVNDCPNESMACLNDSGCSSCNQMLNDGDIDANDACVGAAQDDFTTFFNCVCGPMHPCGDLCAGYCAGMGVTSSCQSCYGSMTATCGHEYGACMAN